MPNYRRNYVQGGTYFFTVTLKNRNSTLMVDHIAHLKFAFNKVKNTHPFHINALVVLPEHLHCIWTLPEGDDNYPARWRAIKTLFCSQVGKELNLVSRKGIWQWGYWEHTIRSDSDFAAHINYVHFNPVKHGHVLKVMDWPYSTFHWYVSNGVYQKDWGGENEKFEKNDFGE